MGIKGDSSSCKVSWLVGQLDELRLGIHMGQLNAVSVPPPP